MTMLPPGKRIWLYPDRTFTKPRDLEIVVLGELRAITSFVVDLRATIERWEGFENLHTIGIGEQALGFRATRSRFATHDDPIAEAMLMIGSPKMAEHRVEWFGGFGSGMVGSW